MNKESTQVFQDRGVLQPEKLKPESINLFPQKEGFQEEKMSSIGKQFGILKVLEISGATEMITKENFPDIPEDRLENFRFFADNARIKELHIKAASTKDIDLKESLSQEAEEVEKQRDERMKQFREKTRGKMTAQLKPSPKVTKPIPPTGQYL